jgi:hypothetical protein
VTDARAFETAALSQKTAARLLGVSVSWLCCSAAPRVLLPGNGPSGRPLLRYDRTALLAWAGLTGSGTQQDAPSSAMTRGNSRTSGGKEPHKKPAEKSVAGSHQ